ncbi:anti-phage dCTP deaminase [Photobacterium chitinilyticum]|uniref:Cytidine deaminase n=1 Tax=Photobacterium chitinilyticum TaxID=2485123 RepID=A0A3S3QND2_9GAMM|nr:anti-phage dCTP deaminase [Photobacterium chitinilyticum]RWX54345.1 cytidine deaminase [Photobacterium chitinilyticum]
MAAAEQKKADLQPPVSKSSSSSTTKNATSLIAKRQAKDIVIGFCGPVGSGVNSLRTSLEEVLTESNYEIEHVHISSIMKNFKEASSVLSSDPDAYNRYIEHQNLGNSLREKYNNAILAEAAIAHITKHREESLIVGSPKSDTSEDTEADIDEKPRSNVRVAYLIDQLKNPAEIELLRLVYQHNFYLIGTIRSEQERKRNLRDEGIDKSKIDDLIHRDRKGDGKSGQHTEKTILDADFFIKNNQSHKTELKKKLLRFIKLIHGTNGISPTVNEKGMYAAFSASLQSACLSRQVGASIVDEKGDVLVTGRNDVPKFGGGLYLFEDEDKDYRCVHKGGKCYNDFHKKNIRKKVASILTKELKAISKGKSLDTGTSASDMFNKDAIDKIADKIHSDTPIGSLIEYSRAIHAEMDAITSLARRDGSSTLNKTLYSTTYPCHNCARHIVAAGINNVFYIEPYDKSLALDLHDDAITEHSERNKVVFQTFEGISPRRYQKFFFAPYDRKDKNTGNALMNSAAGKYQIDVQLIEGYREYEDRICADFISKTSINSYNKE